MNAFNSLENYGAWKVRKWVKNFLCWAIKRFNFQQAILSTNLHTLTYKQINVFIISSVRITRLKFIHVQAPLSTFRERPPRCPRNNDVALCGWCQNDDPAVTEYEPSQLLLHGTGRRNGTYRSILLNATISQSGEKFPWDCLFSPMGLTPASLYLL